MNDSKQEIAFLVEKVQQGDMNAFGKLYELVSPRSLFVALEIVKNKQDAEDILQDSFITALEKINTIDKSESFVGWFNRIVANKSKDFLKKKKPMLFDEEEKQVFELIPDDDREFSPQENFNDNETRKLVLDAVNELSDEKRICVLLHYYNEMSVADIAQTVGANENTVKSRLFQARKDLSAKFKELERKGLYSFSPIGLVLWAWQNSEQSVAEGFIGSETASTILASVTAKAGAATATTAAATTAVGAGTATATGTGIAAKIAALTVAQKVVAGVSVAAVVAGGTAGVVTVANNSDKKDSISTSAYIEEYTTAPSFETTLAIEALGTVEFTETTEESVGESMVTAVLTSKKSTTLTQSVAESKTSVTSAGSTASSKYTTEKAKTTKPTTTVKLTTTTTTKPTSATTQKTTTTTKKTTTTKPTTTTTKPTTTTTTTKPTTTTTRPTTTLADPIIRIRYVPADSQDWVDYPEFFVEPGTEITLEYIYDFMMNKSGLSMVDALIDSGDYTASAEPGEIYCFEVYCI